MNISLLRLSLQSILPDENLRIKPSVRRKEDKAPTNSQKKYTRPQRTFVCNLNNILIQNKYKKLFINALYKHMFLYIKMHKILCIWIILIDQKNKM